MGGIGFKLPQLRLNADIAGRPLKEFIARLLEGTEMEIAGVQYSFTMGSDIIRDGMFLEATAIGAETERVVAEIFYSDASGKFTLSSCADPVSVELIEYLIAEGKRRLPATKFSQSVLR